MREQAAVEPAWGEAAVVDALRRRYPANEWALLAGVRNATGFSSPRLRTADAVALNLWPSKGMPLLGFEVKSSRSDWLREMGQPEKAEEIARFMDQWWIVAGAQGIVKRDELPKTWGLLERRGDELRVVRQAPQLPDPMPLTKGFMTSLFREGVAQLSGEKEIERRVAIRLGEEAEKARRWASKQHQQEIDRLRYQLEHGQRELATWKASLGIDAIERAGCGMGPDVIGHTVASLLNGRVSVEQAARSLEATLNAIRAAATGIESALATLKKGAGT